MLKYIGIAILVIIIICIVYNVVFKNDDGNRRRRYQRALKESPGTFDDNARRALDILVQVEEPTAVDYFTRGGIIQHNILEGMVGDAAMRGVAIGGAAIGGVEEVREIIRDYTDTMHHLRMRRNENIPNIPDTPGPEFMIHRIEDFNRQLVELDDDEIMQLVLQFNDVVADAPAMRQELAEERKERAMLTAPNPAAAIAIALDDATNYTDDRQNVHDTKVNSDLNITLRKIKYDVNPDIDGCIIEARRFIDNVYAKEYPGRVNDVKMVLDKINQGGFISTFDMNENAIFAYVWERSKHPNNAKNSQLIKTAIINALADSVENSQIVCINGRCARVLGSLNTLDFDPEVGSAMTFEAYKNQIFQETKSIIETAIEGVKNSPDIAMKSVGDSFEDINIIPDAIALDKFNEDLRSRISANLKEYRGKLSDNEIENIKQDCFVYAGV